MNNKTKILYSIFIPILTIILFIYSVIIITKFTLEEEENNNFYNIGVLTQNTSLYGVKDGEMITKDFSYYCVESFLGEKEPTQDFLKFEPRFKIKESNFDYWFKTNEKNEWLVNNIIKEVKTKDEVLKYINDCIKKYDEVLKINQKHKDLITEEKNKIKQTWIEK